MSKALTWKKENGEWGIDGVDMALLPPAAYGALCKLMYLEHPVAPTRADALRAMSDKELAAFIARKSILSPCEIICRGECRASNNFNKTSGQTCQSIILDYLLEPAE